VLKKLPFLRYIWLVPATLVVVALGFWLFPEDPGFLGLLLFAIGLPLALLGSVVAAILERRVHAPDDACYEYDFEEPD
jgi:hypothetical protein